jgi:prevent-host-death family protein
MQISVKEAQDNLEKLLVRVEGGEDVLLTKDGKTVARIVPYLPAQKASFVTGEDRVKAIAAIQERVRQKPDPFPDVSAAHSQDFLYDENGLPK